MMKNSSAAILDYDDQLIEAWIRPSDIDGHGVPRVEGGVGSQWEEGGCIWRHLIQLQCI